MYLITGSTGFLGKSIVKYIDSTKIVRLGRDKNSEIIFDFEKNNQIDNNQFNLKIDTIIHAAGLAHIYPSDKSEKNKMNKINVTGTVKLLNYAEKLKKLKKIIFISSVSVYGIDNGKNINENYSPSPNTIYGKSKLDAEKIIIDWAYKNNIKYYILRLPLVVGETPPGNLKKMINAIKNNRFFIIDKGKAKKSMVLANDVGKLISNIKGKSGVYNLNDGYHPSFKEISKLLSKKFNSKPPISIPKSIAKFISKVGTFFLGSKFPLDYNTFIKITSDLTFDDNKARTEISWKSNKVIKNY